VGRAEPDPSQARSVGGTRSLASTARMGTKPPRFSQDIAHHFSVFVTDTPSACREPAIRHLIRAGELPRGLPASQNGEASREAPVTPGHGW